MHLIALHCYYGLRSNYGHVARAWSVLIIALLSLTMIMASPAIASANYSAAVIDANSGQILITRQANKRRPPASLTKMMTALVAYDQLTLKEIVTVGNYKPQPDEQQLGLLEGEQILGNDLLKAALISSANDAAVALSDANGDRGQFLEEMNSRAKKIGLSNTHFKHPAGMDTAGQYTSALDMAFLGQQLMLNPDLANMVSMKDAWLLSSTKPHYITSTNHLLGGPTNGIKTGYTDQANFSVVSSTQQGKRHVITAVLGAPNSEKRFALASSLASRGLALIKPRQISSEGETLATIPVLYNNSVELHLKQSIVIWTASNAPVRGMLVNLPEKLEGPLSKGTRVGKVEFMMSGKKIAESPLFLANSISAPSAWQSIFFKMPLLPLLIILLISTIFYHNRRQKTNKKY